MNLNNKVFYLSNLFEKTASKEEDDEESIFISGYASVNSPDRVGDVIPSKAWDEGMTNYLKNPVVLTFHNHSNPCGRVTEHKVDEKGLWVKARISSASNIYNLVKDGIVTAFSVGFKINDAEYKPDIDIFIIKALELMEISVVSVPMHQDTLFSLSKSFKDDEEYRKFKTLFVTGDDLAKGQNDPGSNNDKYKETVMTDQKDFEKLLEDATAKAAKAATEALERKLAEDARKKAEADEAERALQARIKAAVAEYTPASTTGAEKLLEELTKRIEESDKTNKSLVEGLEAALKEKADELEKIQRSKMSFSDKSGRDDITIQEKETAVLLSKIANKSVESTKFGKQLLEKALGASTTAQGPHLASQTWEHEVSTRMEDEIRRRLVVAPLLREVPMQTNVMTIPINPEAGYATWVASTSYGTTASAGATKTHALKELTINAYKLATREYIRFEETEDSLLVLVPIIRDAMVRRTAKTVDRGLLWGNGGTGTASSDAPFTSLAMYDATSAVTMTSAGQATVATLRSLRKDLGVWGLETDNVIYVVSTEVYYDLLDDTNFMTMDKVGDRATLLTGQVGSVGNIPVVVSGEFYPKTGVTAGTAGHTVGALCLNRGNFLLGSQRGLRFDTQDLVEQQQRVLVASVRLGLQQISTVDGMAVSAFRWLP